MVSEEKYLCGNSLAVAHAVPEAAGERGMCGGALYKFKERNAFARRKRWS